MSAVELHPHQEEAVEKMHNGCVLNGDVGTGKTITALAYAMLKEPGRDIYVITTAKKRDGMDWHNEAMKLGIHADHIFVDSWNNIKHYHKVHGALFIFDEQRLVGTGAWVKTFYDIARKNHWILLSATPGDTWLDYAPVFIANGFYKNITQFRQEHVVYMPRVKYPKVQRYLDEPKLMRLKWKIMVEMPMERHTTRHIEMIECDYDKEVFKKVWTRRWNVYDDCPIQDAGELFRVGRKVVASDSSRLQKVRQLLTTHPKLIVFYNFDYELEILRTLADTRTESPESAETASPSSTALTAGSSSLSSSDQTTRSESSRTSGSTHSASTSRQTRSGTDSASQSGPGSTAGTPCGPRTTTDTSLKGTIWETGFDETTGRMSDSFQIAEWNGHKHEKVPNTDSWVYLVQYTSGCEGWNCTTTDATVFYSLTYSYKQFYQSQGRIDRMNTPFKDLYYYVLTSRSIVDKAVWRALSMKKDFQVRSKSW